MSAVFLSPYHYLLLYVQGAIATAVDGGLQKKKVDICVGNKLEDLWRQIQVTEIE